MATATEKWIENLQAAMKAVSSMDIDERTRATLRRACSESLVTAEDQVEFDYEHRNSSKKWGKDDLEILESTLKDAPPCSGWNEEKIILMTLTRRLGRPEKIVKTKAIEMGYGSKVDYWMNEKNR